MARPIRVLRLIARMNVGGPSWQVATLTRHLDPREFETRLVAGHVGAGETDYVDLRAPDLPVVRLDSLGRSVRPYDDVTALRDLVREIRRFRPDVVHTHTAKAGVLGRIAARVTGVPVIVHTFHGHLLSGYFSRSGTSAVRVAERGLARISTCLVAVGEQVRDELLAARIGSADQYRVIPPGVALPAAPDRATARRRLGLPDSVPVVLFAARLTGVKRPDRFVAAARRVAADDPSVVFVVAGDGPLLEEMQRQCAPLAHRFHFLGWRPDVETVYAAADVVALTSDNEGTPIVLIEAAMAGRACVTTDVGSAPEVVLDGVTGRVTAREPDAVAAAVTTLLRDPALRDRMGCAARDHANTRFGAARLVDDTASLYRELVERRLGRRTRH